jgi:hypothetical protein
MMGKKSTKLDCLPFQHAYNTTGSCWDWLAKNPEALDRFNTFMEGSRDDLVTAPGRETSETSEGSRLGSPP